MTLKHINCVSLCNIHGTVDFGRHLYPSFFDKLTTYNDVHWGGCTYTIRYMFGYCVYIGDDDSQSFHIFRVFLVKF